MSRGLQCTDDEEDTETFSPSEERQWEELRAWGSRQASIQSPEGVQCLKARRDPAHWAPCHPRPSGTETTAPPHAIRRRTPGLGRLMPSSGAGTGETSVFYNQVLNLWLTSVKLGNRERAEWSGGKTSPHLCLRETKTGLSNWKRRFGTEREGLPNKIKQKKEENLYQKEADIQAV